MAYKDKEKDKAYHKEYHKKWYQKNKEKRYAQIAQYKHDNAYIRCYNCGNKLEEHRDGKVTVCEICREKEAHRRLYGCF